MSQRGLALAGLVVAQVALTADAAHATTEVSRSGGRLVVTADPGAANAISVSRLGFSARVTVADAGDTVGYTATSGCSRVSDYRVDCPLAEVSVLAHDRDDSVTVLGLIPTTLDGGAGDDTLLGGQGPDALVGGPDADVLDGGTGLDRADYSARVAPVNASINGVDDDGAAGEGDNVTATVEDLIGGSAPDTLTGSNTANGLYGRAGADTLGGLGDNDTLNGGSENDLENGGEGDDTFTVGAGDGADTFNGGPGTVDHATYATRSTRVVADIDGIADDGAAGEGDNVKTDVEQLTGGAAHDTLRGSSSDNVLDGGANWDDLSGLAGDDRLRGRDGDDNLHGGTDEDFLEGGADDDSILGGTGGDGLRGGAGDDLLAGAIDGAGDSLHGEAGYDACGGDPFYSRVGCEE